MVSPTTIRDAVEATIAAKSARLMVARPDSGPVPDETDVTGLGLADLQNDRVWLIHRGSPPRVTKEQRATGTWMGHAFARWGSRRRESYFEGDTRAKRGRRRRWKEALPLFPGQRIQNPLWMLGPLSRLDELGEEDGKDDLVRGVGTERYEISLTEAVVDDGTWERIAQPDAPEPSAQPRWRRHYPQAIPRTALPAAVWLDGEGRIRRMSVEETRLRIDSSGEITSSWRTTELWEFGVRVDRQRPPLPPPGDAFEIRRQMIEDEQSR